MRPLRVTLSRLALLVGAVSALASVPAAHAADAFKVEALKEAPPSTVAAPLREALADQGYRVVDAKGKTYADIWLRKAVPASEAPGPPKGSVQFPYLGVGEFLGVLRYGDEGHDNRDQTIPAGIYTLRYGLQPENGDHLGVSTFRDYVLLLPAAKDAALANVAPKLLQERSSESAGTTHPAVLLLSTGPATGPATQAVHDQEKDTWGAILPLNVQAKGADSATPVRIKVLFLGVLGG